MSGRARALTGLAVMALALLIAALLDRFTDARSPLWDSSNTALALAAQYWQARRRIETWPLWIAVNIGSAGLYATQGLWITSLTYAVLLGLALHGWRAWQSAALRVQRC
jgi:nicotinamide mononucleotide transporter